MDGFRLRLGRGSLVCHCCTGEGVFDCAKNPTGAVGRPGHRVHLPALRLHHLGHHAHGTVEEGIRLAGGRENADFRDLPLLNRHLYLHRAAVSSGGAGINAVRVAALCLLRLWLLRCVQQCSLGGFRRLRLCLLQRRRRGQGQQLWNHA